MATPNETKNKFWNALSTFFTDLITLDVVTMTGEISLTIDDISGFENIIEKLKEKTANLTTVAVSHHEIDYDAAMFIKQNLDDDEKEILKLHLETVKSAQEMRNKVVELATNALKLLA
jgi:cyanate lyase